MKSAGKARSNGLYRHIRTSKEIIRNLLNYYMKYRNYLEEMMCALQMLEAKFGDVLEKYPPFSKEWEEEKRSAISILASIK